MIFESVCTLVEEKAYYSEEYPPPSDSKNTLV